MYLFKFFSTRKLFRNFKGQLKNLKPEGQGRLELKLEGDLFEG
jgi:hypothetical protein